MKGIITFLKDLVDKGARHKAAEHTPFGSVQFLMVFITALVTVADQLGKFFGYVPLEKYIPVWMVDYSFFIPPVIFILLLIWCAKVIMRKKEVQESEGLGKIKIFFVYDFSSGQRWMAKFVLLFCLVLGTNSVTFACKEVTQVKGKLTGEIKDKNNFGVYDATITLVDKKGRSLKGISTTTDGSGYFSIDLENEKITLKRSSQLFVDVNGVIIARLSLSSIYETDTDKDGNYKSPY